MTFPRFVFVFALAMLSLGVFGSRFIVHALFGTATGPTVVALNVSPSTPTPTSTARPTASQRVPTARPVRTPTATPRPTRTSLPTPSPTPGTVTLLRYWVGAAAARRGSTVSVGYVIDNETGHTARIELGASLKSTRVPSWIAGGVSDPAHDVVAVVPPGTSTHIRFFTLPTLLRPGWYDVAWGLRGPVTGQRIALVTAGAAIWIRQ